MLTRLADLGALAVAYLVTVAVAALFAASVAVESVLDLLYGDPA